MRLRRSAARANDDHRQPPSVPRFASARLEKRVVPAGHVRSEKVENSSCRCAPRPDGLGEEERDALTAEARELLGDPVRKADLYDLEQQIQDGSRRSVSVR